MIFFRKQVPTFRDLLYGRLRRSEIIMGKRREGGKG